MPNHSPETAKFIIYVFANGSLVDTTIPANVEHAICPDNDGVQLETVLQSFATGITFSLNVFRRFLG